MGFQNQVYTYPAPAVVGARASMNPTATIAAGPLGLTAGALGLTVGKFAWVSYATAGGPGVANNFSPTAPVVPGGFVNNEQQALVTTWLGVNGLVVPPGYQCTLFGRGDFWAKTIYRDAAVGNKVYANLFSGDVYPGVTGLFALAGATGGGPYDSVGASAVLTGSLVAGSYTLTLTANVVSGTVTLGQQITGPGLTNGNYYVDAGGTATLPLAAGSGNTQTIFLTQAAVSTQTAQSFSTIANTGIGGCVCSSVSSSSSTTMTINTVTSGTIVPGQLIQGITSIPAGTYVASIGTFNGTSGTIIMSAASTGTITAQACNFSAWIETPWYFLSSGNAGDICKIGILN